MIDMIFTEKVNDAFFDVRKEFAKACEQYKSMNSAHEGYAVILEELDELWDEIKKKPSDIDSRKLRNEAKQVAAMAIRFMVDVCLDVD